METGEIEYLFKDMSYASEHDFILKVLQINTVLHYKTNLHC